MSVLRSRFVQAVVILVGAFLALRFGIRPPAPWSVIQIYIRSCMFCHGDNLDGHGLFASALNPPPANFEDPGTIAMLQESYLFWRIAKGGPGLPRESTPWNSAMPAWEDRLTEEQIWQVIAYLYDATGQEPRRWETAH